MCKLVLPPFLSIEGRTIGQRDAPFTGTKSAVWVSVYVAICRAAGVEHAAKEQQTEGFQRRWSSDFARLKSVRRSLYIIGHNFRLCMTRAYTPAISACWVFAYLAVTTHAALPILVKSLFLLTQIICTPNKSCCFFICPPFLFPSLYGVYHFT